MEGTAPSSYSLASTCAPWQVYKINKRTKKGKRIHLIMPCKGGMHCKAVAEAWVRLSGVQLLQLALWPWSLEPNDYGGLKLCGFLILMTRWWRPSKILCSVPSVDVLFWTLWWCSSSTTFGRDPCSVHTGVKCHNASCGIPYCRPHWERPIMSEFLCNSSDCRDKSPLQSFVSSEAEPS